MTKKNIWNELIKEITENKGFRPKLAIVGYRLGFICYYEVHNKIIKGIFMPFYILLKIFCNVFSCGELPPRKVYIGWGLKIPHAFINVIMTSGVIIGNNCTILHGVTLGSITNMSGYHNRISIGNDCFIGANTLILGDCEIGNNCKIGGGSKLIFETIPDHSTVVTKVENKIITKG